MKIQIVLVLFTCISLMLSGAVMVYYSQDEKGISKEEAERIALEKDEEDGFLSPTLWERFDTESSLGYEFSVERNEDVKSWQVYIDTEDNPAIKNTPAAIYYISHNNGEVIRVINGLQ